MAIIQTSAWSQSSFSLQNSLTDAATIWRPEKLNSCFLAFLREELEMARMTNPNDECRRKDE